jgi:hypothetical protein
VQVLAAATRHVKCGERVLAPSVGRDREHARWRRSPTRGRPVLARWTRPRTRARPPLLARWRRPQTRALATRVWARSLGGQRTADERTTSRPNTQPGLPSKAHLWQLPRSRPSPRRCAARCRDRDRRALPARAAMATATLTYARPPLLARWTRPRTRALATRVWARSLGGQRTADERTASRPNTQPGLPSKAHLWQLPRSRPSPRRCAARCRGHDHRALPASRPPVAMATLTWAGAA